MPGIPGKPRSPVKREGYPKELNADRNEPFSPDAPSRPGRPGPP